MGTPIGVEIHFQLEIAAPVKVQPRDATPLLCHWLNHQLVEYMYDKYKHIIY